MGAVIGDTPAISVEGHPPARGHLPALDGLRGVAILLVLMTHAVGLAIEPATTGLDRVAHGIAQVGWTGVDLFFVLSGFLITGILLDTRDEPRRWVRFFARRSLRIFPLYYGVLVLLFVVLPFAHWSDPQYTTLRANQAWYWAYAVNFLNIFTRGDGTPLNTVHFWSLSIEEQFYIFWPFVIWALKPRDLFKLALVVFSVGLVVRIWLAATDPFGFMATSYVMTPVRLDALMTGAVLAALARMPGGLPRWRNLSLRVGAGGAAILLALTLWRGGLRYTDPLVSTIGFPLIALTFGALLVLTLTAPKQAWTSRMFCNSWLRSWGKYSYGIYVFHYLVIGALGWKVAFQQRGVAWLGGSKLPTVLLFAVLASGLTYGAAWLSYQVFEKRFLALKRYFDREPVRRNAPVSAGAMAEPGLR